VLTKVGVDPGPPAAPPPAEVVKEEPPPPRSQSACEVLLPKELGVPVTVTMHRLPQSLGPSPGTSDGEGHVLLQLAGSMGNRVLQLYAPDGRSLATADSYDVDLLPVARGFLGMRGWTRSPPPGSQTVLFAGGEWLLESGPSQPGRMQQASDPTGGIKALAQATGELQSYDDRAQLRWRAALSLPTQEGEASALALGVDRHGNTLVVFDGTEDFEAGTVAGLWVDAAGHVGSKFRVLTNAPRPVSVELFAAADAGLFLKQYGVWESEASPWVGRFVPGVESAQPVPAFLASRRGAVPQVVRGGAAYALPAHRPFNSERAGVCEVELFDPEGNACGTLGFAVAGHACDSITLGRDGTVFIQPSLNESNCDGDTTGDCDAIWSWWPAVLK
jgi:hypothetical protein